MHGSLAVRQAVREKEVRTCVRTATVKVTALLSTGQLKRLFYDAPHLRRVLSQGVQC